MTGRTTADELADATCNTNLTGLRNITVRRPGPAFESEATSAVEIIRPYALGDSAALTWAGSRLQVTRATWLRAGQIDHVVPLVPPQRVEHSFYHSGGCCTNFLPVESYPGIRQLSESCGDQAVH
jgi:hypothetical protein